MIGKLITVGISEQGKTRAENVMMTQRSGRSQKFKENYFFKSCENRESDVTGRWENPTDNSPQRLVWKKFISHDHLFYDSQNPDGWDFINRDSMMFTLSVTGKLKRNFEVFF